MNKKGLEYRGFQPRSDNAQNFGFQANIPAGEKNNKENPQIPRPNNMRPAVQKNNKK